MTSFTPNSKRIFGFDLLRLLSMVAIITFHVNEAIFWQDGSPLPGSLSLYRPFEFYSQHMTFSGFTIIALSFFLLGKGRQRNFILLLGFIFLGIAVIAAAQENPPFTGFYWEWDIYSFLAVSILAIQFLVWVPRLLPLTAGMAFLATWIPVWRLVPNAADNLSQALVGICPPSGVASWPLLPWLAWPILFFSLGGWYRQSEKFKSWTTTIGTKEGALWGLVLAGSLPFYGAFNWVPIGPHFYCHTLRIEPYLFWSTMIWVIFAMRISMLGNINLWLSKKKWAVAISDMRWNRYFGVTYLVHLTLLGLGIYLRENFIKHPWLFDIYFISILPMAEGLVRGGEKILKCWHDRVRAKN